MKTKRLGRTELRVTENSFGALPIQRLSTQAAADLLFKAFEAGINFFDTAHTYTDSEEKIGVALSKVRKNIVISTKTPETTRQGVLRDLDTSLRNMKTDYVDILQLHNIPALPDINDPEGAYAGLLEAKKLGKCLFIGITSHRLDVAIAAAESELFDTVQYPISYLATEEELKLIQICKEHDVGLIAMKGMSGGLIFSGTAAFAFFSQYDNVVPIWGIQKESELMEFIDCAEKRVTMTPELAKIIENDRKTLVGNFCRGCGYCKPCPAGIDIAQVARMKLMLRRAPWQEYTTKFWQDEMEKAKDCIHCGACKTRCPYHLDCPTLVAENYADFVDFCKEKGIK